MFQIIVSGVYEIEIADMKTAEMGSKKTLIPICILFYCANVHTTKGSDLHIFDLHIFLVRFFSTLKMKMIRKTR